MGIGLHVLRLTGHAGDAIMARPVIRAFRAAHPTDRLYLEAPTEHHELLSGLREVDFVRPLGGSKNIVKPVSLCDFSEKSWVGTWRHIMDHMASRCGVSVVDRSYALPLPADKERWADAEAARLGPFAALHVRSNLPSKDWPLTSFAAVRDGLRSRLGLACVQVGGNGDPRIPGPLAEDYRGRLSWLETAALLSRASLFVGPDSGCMHVSRAVREVPAIVLWGATSPLTSGLFGGSIANLEPSRLCGHGGRPCHTRCDWTEPCVNSLAVEDALAAAERLVKPPAATPALSVVLVNWNSFRQYTRQFVYRLDATMRSDWELILVDNGSVADRPTIDAYTHPRLSAKIMLPENLGLPKAWNEALRLCRAPVVALLNTDLAVESEGWDLEALNFFGRHPGAAALGMSLNEPGGFFGESWSKEPLPLEPGREARCHHVNGSSWFITRRALDRVGGFDLRYTPGYCEETDWCMKAVLAHEEVWHLSAAFRHERHGVTRRVNKMDLAPVVQRNNAYFAGKWEGAELSWPGAVPARKPEAATA